MPDPRPTAVAPRFRAKTIRLTGVSRGTVDETERVAEEMRWLFSAAPSFVTDTTLRLDGGRTAGWA